MPGRSLRAAGCARSPDPDDARWPGLSQDGRPWTRRLRKDARGGPAAGVKRTRQGADPPMATTTYDRRPGWLTLAVIFMFAVSFVRIISAINYFQGGDQISDLTNSIFGDNLWVWGAWDLFLAAFGLGAAISLLSGGGVGPVVGCLLGLCVVVARFF